jgi:hypothetical protein
MKNKVYLLFSPLAAVQNNISNLLENYFQNIFMKLAEKKLNNFVFLNQSIVLQYEYFFEEHQTGLSD